MWPKPTDARREHTERALGTHHTSGNGPRYTGVCKVHPMTSRPLSGLTFPAQRALSESIDPSLPPGPVTWPPPSRWPDPFPSGPVTCLPPSRPGDRPRNSWWPTWRRWAATAGTRRPCGPAAAAGLCSVRAARSGSGSGPPRGPSRTPALWADMAGEGVTTQSRLRVRDDPSPVGSVRRSDMSPESNWIRFWFKLVESELSQVSALEMWIE